MTYNEFIQAYEREDLIGGGGFGQVFKAYDKKNERYVAIKRSEVKPEFKEFTLMREYELSKEIPNHPNICPYEACFRFQEGFIEADYAILKYFEYGNISELLQKNKLNDREKRHIIKAILYGVSHLHKQNIIHRDLKAGNILIDREDGIWSPKITDFGLSKVIDKKQLTNSLLNSSIGVSFQYAAPEQITGDSKILPNVDLWAVGVLIYQIINDGKFPFNSDHEETTKNQTEVAYKVTNLKFPRDLKQISQPYLEIIEKCWIKDIHQRIQSAEELLEILQGKNKENKLKTDKKSTPEIKKANSETYSDLSDKSAEWFNSKERRDLWWNQLEDQWKKAFNELWIGKSTFEKLEDNLIEEIFDTTRVLFVGKDGYLLEEDMELGIYPLSFQLTNISGITNLTNLISLWCNNNKLTSINELQELKRLTFLKLDNNQLSSIKALKNHRNIEYLGCSDNKLTSLDGIENLTKLETFSFMSNSISLLKPLEKLLEAHETKTMQIFNLDNPIREVIHNGSNINEAEYLKEKYPWLEIYQNEDGISENEGANDKTKIIKSEITNHEGESIIEDNKYFYDAPVEIGKILSKDSNLWIKSTIKHGYCSYVGEKGISIIKGKISTKEIVFQKTLVFSKDIDLMASMTDHYQEDYSGDRYTHTTFDFHWKKNKKLVFKITNWDYPSLLKFALAAQYRWSIFKYEYIRQDFDKNKFLDFYYNYPSSSYIRITGDSVSHYKKNDKLVITIPFDSIEVLTNPGIFYFRDIKSYKKSTFKTSGELIITRNELYNVKVFLWIFNHLTGHELN